MITKTDIKDEAGIVFEHPHDTLIGYIRVRDNGHTFSNISGDSNGKPFDLIGVHPYRFTKKVVGYQCSGDWPEQKNPSDFAAVLNAMLEHDLRLKIKIGGKEFGYEGRLSISLEDFFKVK